LVWFFFLKRKKIDIYDQNSQHDKIKNSVHGSEKRKTKTEDTIHDKNSAHGSEKIKTEDTIQPVTIIFDNDSIIPLFHTAWGFILGWLGWR